MSSRVRKVQNGGAKSKKMPEQFSPQERRLRELFEIVQEHEEKHQYCIREMLQIYGKVSKLHPI